MRTKNPYPAPVMLLLALLCLTVNAQAQGSLQEPHHNVTSPSIVGCLDCHDLTAVGWPKFIPEPPGYVARNPDALENENTTFNLKCWECHSGSTVIAGGAAKSLGNKAAHSSLAMGSTTYGEWAAGCTVCHNAHSQGGQPGGKFIWNFARLDQIEVYGAKTPKIGKKTIIFNGPTGPKSFADGDATYDGVCEVCHTETAYHRNNSSGDHAHYASQHCTNCHSHDSGFKPGTVCLDCHYNSVNARTAIGAQLSGNSHHIQGVALSSDQCYQCHWEADINGEPTIYHTPETSGSAVDLVIRDNNDDTIPDPRPGTYTLGATALQYTAGTSTALELNPHCLGCHNDDFNNYTTGGGIFGDGKAPNQYAWDGTCSNPLYFDGKKSECLSNGWEWTPGSSVKARYSQTGASTWGKYTTATYVAKKNILKAYSAHGNAATNARGWDTSNGVDGTINNTSGSVNVACFDCHNSHGSTVAGTTTSYATSDTVNGGILKETSAGKGGYSVTYKPEAGGSSANKNLRNAGASLCLDCHLTPAGLSIFDYETPWGYQSTFQAVQPIIGYFDSPYLAPGTAGPQLRYPYKGLTTNAGGHFGPSSPLSSTPMHNIDGLCTPCHDPHGVSLTLDTNQQYGVPLLKGTWLTSPYKEDAAPSSTNLYTGPLGGYVRSTPGYNIDQNTFTDSSFIWNLSSTTGINENAALFAGLCLNCHTNDGSAADIDPDGGTQNNQWKTMDRIHDTVKGWGSGSKPHKFPCSKCHTPHNGSILPRLMVTSCLDFQHRSRKTFGGAPGRQTVTGISDDCDMTVGGSGSFPGGGHGSGEGCDGSGSNTYYFGGVSCHDNVGIGSWPDNQLWNQVTTWTNVPPTVPTITDQPDTTSTSITLQWDSSTDPEGDAIQYYVVIDDASTFPSINYNSGWITGTSHTFTVASNKIWYWQVKARDAYNESGWSASDSFMVSDGLAPGQVTLLSPENGAQINNYPGEVTFSWNAQPAFAQYRVWVDDEAGFAGPHVYDSGWIAATSQAVNIPTAGTYYWRVQARDSLSFATGTVSATRNFGVDNPPTVPVLTPEPDTTAFEITLDWGASTDPEGNDPVQYYVQVDDASNFSSPDYVMDWNTATNFSFTATNNIWYWRVKAKDSLNFESVYSSADSFSIYIPGAPDAPTLSWPPDGYYDQVGFPAGTNLLQWNASAGATEYYCEYWYAGFSWSSGWIAATSFDPGDLSDNITYYWRVKARNASGESGWSVIWSWYDYWGGDSCPFIFTWNGNRYEYVTDIQGPVIGLPSVTPAARSVVLFQPTCVVLNDLVPDNEKYRIKLRETLKEITYLDEVKLLVADYPVGYELVSSTAENTYSYGYVTPEMIYTIKDPRLPVSAFSTAGDDILASVGEVDNVFAPLDYNKPEHITLDFGVVTDPTNAKLVMEGWTIYSADLRTSDAVQPFIEVLDPDGNWVKVVSFGEPAGDLKRIVIPLADVFQNSDQRIRLHLGKKSGGRWRLDRVMLDESAPVPITVAEVEAIYADLYHGQRVPHSPNSLSSRIFAEDGILPDDPEAYGYGLFTRYGDILPLLTSADDKFAIMRHGDAVDLEFAEIQAPNPGLTRSYLLKTDLYYKSFRVENNVEPLPFHGMSIYPPADGESYPADAEHTEYLETYNTREYVEGQ